MIHVYIVYKGVNPDICVGILKKNPKNPNKTPQYRSSKDEYKLGKKATQNILKNVNILIVILMGLSIAGCPAAK